MPVFAAAMAKKGARKQRVVAEEDDEGSVSTGSVLDTTDSEAALLTDDTGSEASDEEVESDDDAPAAVDVEFSEPAAWVERMALSATKPLPEDLDPNDDPKREEVFTQHALLSVRRGIAMLERAGVKWNRPGDYYAEMYKSDVHMDKIRESMMRSKKAVQERAHRRAMKEQKKFGKEVQADVLRQRAATKREGLAKVAEWRKKRGKNSASLDEALGEGDDKKKGRRDAFRKPGQGGAKAKGARKALAPGRGGAAKKRPGKMLRRKGGR